MAASEIIPLLPKSFKIGENDVDEAN